MEWGGQNKWKQMHGYLERVRKKPPALTILNKDA